MTSPWKRYAGPGLLAAGTAFSLLACANPTVPPVSAAAACRDFTTWATQYLITDGGQHPMTGYAALHLAAVEAPSGPLQEQLSELDLAAANPPASASPVLTPGTPNNYLAAVDLLTQQAAHDCTAVNPAS